MADMIGRTCQDQAEQVEIVQLFRMLCEERDIFGSVPANWLSLSDVQEIGFTSPQAAVYALQETHRQRLMGLISDPYQAKARCWELAKLGEPPRVIITVGVSGSGKSSQINKFLQKDSQWKLIDLDQIREKLYGDQSIQGDGEVIQTALSQLKEQLRIPGSRTIYHATNVIPDLRSKIVGLCHDYHAHVTLWVWDVSKDELKKRNKLRSKSVPEYVIDKQCSKFEWPLPEEAHNLEIFQ